MKLGTITCHSWNPLESHLLGIRTPGWICFRKCSYSVDLSNMWQLVIGCVGSEIPGHVGTALHLRLVPWLALLDGPTPNGEDLFQMQSLGNISISSLSCCQLPSFRGLPSWPPKPVVLTTTCVSTVFSDSSPSGQLWKSRYLESQLNL